MDTRYFFHVDLDAFFAACHVARDPTLKGKPLIVGGDPVRGRGVVSTCSYEARKYGVRSAMPVSQAQQLCPQAIYVKPDFSMYSAVSRKIMTYLRVITKESHDIPGKFQQAGMDEAYLDFTDRIVTHGLDPVALAVDIKEQVKKLADVTCSIGIAPTKTCAKIASDENKPDGITFVPPNGLKVFLAPLPVRRIPGIGKKGKEQLKRWGIETAGQLQQFPVENLPEHWKYFWEVVNGLHPGEVHEEGREPKSISKERTFFDCVKAGEEIYRIIENLTEKLQEEMTEHGFACRTVTVKIRRKDFKTFTRSLSLPGPVTESGLIAGLAKDILKNWMKEEENRTGSKPLFRLLGVRLSNFSGEREVVKPLLTWF
ncbi:MAG: DNA polymerase IV [Candidatus Odinarchaeota archaeon]